MSLNCVNAKFLLGLFRGVALFLLGSCVGACGSLFGLIGTQAMHGDESAFEIFFTFGMMQILSWGMGGVVAAAGFRRNRLSVAVRRGFIGGGIFNALILTALLRTGVGFNIYDAIALQVLPPAIGGAMLVRAMYVTRTLNNSIASDSPQEAAD